MPFPEPCRPKITIRNGDVVIYFRKPLRGWRIFIVIYFRKPLRGWRIIGWLSIFIVIYFRKPS